MFGISKSPTPPPSSRSTDSLQQPGIPKEYISNPLEFFQPVIRAEHNKPNSFALANFSVRLCYSLAHTISPEDINKGDGVPKEFKFIFELPDEDRVAAHNEFYFAQGKIFEQGVEAGTHSAEFAIEFYSKAAEQGCEKSTFAMTQMFLKGQGLSFHSFLGFDLAKKILTSEFNKGTPNAEYQLSVLHARALLNPFLLRHAEALAYFKQAKEANNASVLNTLATIYAESNLGDKTPLTFNVCVQLLQQLENNPAESSLLLNTATDAQSIKVKEYLLKIGN